MNQLVPVGSGLSMSLNILSVVSMNSQLNL